MLNLNQRSNRKELLDDLHIPANEVIRNMKELNTINTYLGGHAITLLGFRKLMGHREKISILEIGCGGGDNLKVIERFCNNNSINLDCFGVDNNADIAAFAATQNPAMQIVCDDYRNLKLEKAPDIIFSSLFCHHFSEEELVEQIIWMKENATVGFFINDLHRHSLAYYSIKMLTKLFSKSYLVKNDAPLSVARGFTMKEWKSLFEKAGISNYSISWKWAFRHLIICSHGE
jgi:SAM-dependent methyltransferase